MKTSGFSKLVSSSNFNKPKDHMKSTSISKTPQIDFTKNISTFRQLGQNTKYKTSKHSPEKNQINERNYSEEHSKIIQNKNSNLNPKSSNSTNINNISINFKEKLQTQTKPQKSSSITFNTNLSNNSGVNSNNNLSNFNQNKENVEQMNELDFIKNKLLKKKEKGKLQSNFLNFTNPLQNHGNNNKQPDTSNLKNYKQSDDKNNEKSLVINSNIMNKRSTSIIEEPLENPKKYLLSKAPSPNVERYFEKNFQDSKNPIKFSYSEHLKNDNLKKKQFVSETQKNTPKSIFSPVMTSKIDMKDSQNNFNKDSRFAQPHTNQSSRKSSIEKTLKNSMLAFSGNSKQSTIKNNQANTSNLTGIDRQAKKYSIKGDSKNSSTGFNNIRSQENKDSQDMSKKASPHQKTNSDFQSKIQINQINNYFHINNIIQNVDSRPILEQNKVIISKENIGNVANIVYTQKSNQVKSPRSELKPDFVKEEKKKTGDFTSKISQNNFIQKNVIIQGNNITKKVSTSTNSPKNMQINFKKEPLDREIKNPANHKSSNSISNSQRQKEESGSKVVSLKLNFNNIKSQQNKAEKNKNDLNLHKKEVSEIDLIEKKSLDHILNTSNCSVKSTLRESNYYRKEAEKLSNYIKQYYNDKQEYPPSNIKFYKYGRLIGKGAFGKVNLSLHIASGRLVAIKSFNKKNLTSENSTKKIFYEIKLMKNLRHPSIVKIFEYFENPSYVMIVMEYIYGGDLLSFVRKRTKLNEMTSRHIFKQIIEGLQYIHSQGIIHRDIKLDNILIDLKNNIKIADFGVSKLIKKGDIMKEQCGTPAYIAPEILKNNGYEGFSADIWSSGVVLYAMLTGTVPFKANNISDLQKSILQGSPPPMKDVSDEANILVSGLLEIDPKKRLTTEQILNHPWFKICDLKNKAKLNIFTNAEKILLSKSNIDFRNANKEDLIENFTLKNLDSLQDTENQNINTKSYILAPFNSSLKNLESFMSNDLKIENDVVKIIGKAKEANRHYELNNNGEIDNGILINQPEIKENNSIKEGSPLLAATPGYNSIKGISKPVSPPNEPLVRSNIPSPKENKKKENSFVVDYDVLKLVEEIGFSNEFIMKSLLNNECNYAVAAYYLYLNSKQDNEVTD